METKDSNGGTGNSSMVFSYLTLRKIVGILGILLPFLLVFGAAIYSGSTIIIENSISRYFYTSARHIFGGVLFVVAFFLFAYEGYDDTNDSISNCGFFLCKINLSDDLTGNLACLFAIGLTLFPTTPKGQPTGIVGILHYVFATGFFLCLIYFSLCLFTKSKSTEMTNRKLSRNKIYKICGYVMLVCIILIPVIALLLTLFGNSGAEDESIHAFVLETIALWAFGVSWFVKGETILKDI